MFKIRLADLCVCIDNKYSFVERQCKNFVCDCPTTDFTVSVTDEQIKAEQTNGDFSAGYCESICLYRRICEEMATHGVFLLHSSVLEVDGYAYAFAAKSGVGKSTHTALWLKNIPNARVLNGDKPLYRIENDGSLTVFGTPWNGKEGWGENISAPLKAICFIERGEVNTIRPASEMETVSRLMHQLYLRGDRSAIDRQLSLTK